MESGYRVGERVDGLYDENTDGMWYPGRVRCVHAAETRPDGSSGPIYEVLYDDGEMETQVRPEFLRQHVPGTICVGTRVLSRYDGGDEAYPGQVADVQSDGRYTIAYDDGEVEEDVALEFIKEQETEAPTSAESEPIQQQEQTLDSNVDTVNSSEEPSSPRTGEPSVECTDIVDALGLLESRLENAVSTKSELSILVKQMRAYPQLTVNLIQERDGERLVLNALKFHQSHAVIQCYGFVLLRRLCFLCAKSTHYLLRNDIIEIVLQAMNTFAEDAILQASACGALAVFTRVHAGLRILLEYQVSKMVLSTLVYHKTYSVHTRQVHYYACEVLLELSELGDEATLGLLCDEQDGEMSPISLLLFLLRQGLALDDKKACCAVGSLLMCLAASGRQAAGLILGLNGLAELSTVMARFPTEPSIQKYSSGASKQLALCSVRQSPTKRVKETASEILRETASRENLQDRLFVRKSEVRDRSGHSGRRKTGQMTGTGASRAQRTSAGGPKLASPTRSASQNPFPVHRDLFLSTPTQQPSSLILLGGRETSSKRRLMAKEERQSELFDTYGVHGLSNSANERAEGMKRAQLKTHLLAAESWATSVQSGQQVARDDLPTTPSARKPQSSRSDYHDQAIAASQRQSQSQSSRYNRWDGENEGFDPELRPEQGPKPKKRHNRDPLGSRSAFQVRIENETQLRISKETFASPQRLGGATKRAVKARQKRLAADLQTNFMVNASNDASSESLNAYATQLFHEEAGTSTASGRKLTPREKEELKERERLSFAEKLHKMIDKANATLANSNTTSMETPEDDPARSSRSAASSKPSRSSGKVRQTAAKRSETVKTPPKAHTTSGNAVKAAKMEESAELPVPKKRKASSVASKRQIGASQAAANRLAAPRAKPSSIRPAAAPKPTPTAKVSSSVKPNKADVQRSEAEARLEGDKQVDMTAAGAILTTSAEKNAEMPREMEISEAKPELETSSAVEAVETDLSSKIPADEAKQEAPEPSGQAASEVEVAVLLVEGGIEAGSIATPSEESVEAEPEADADLAVTASMEPFPSPEADAVASLEPEIPAAEAVSDGSPTVPSPSEVVVESRDLVEGQQDAARQGVEQQPTEAEAIVDALYGDEYHEFNEDGDGGEGEDSIAGEPETGEPSVPETPASSSDSQLQSSKNGEELYAEDGYNEFDEEEPLSTAETKTEDDVGETTEEDSISGQEASDLAVEGVNSAVEALETSPEDVGTRADVRSEEEEASVSNAAEQITPDDVVDVAGSEAEQLMPEGDAPGNADEQDPATCDPPEGHILESEATELPGALSNSSDREEHLAQEAPNFSVEEAERQEDAPVEREGGDEDDGVVVVVDPDAELDAGEHGAPEVPASSSEAPLQSSRSDEELYEEDAYDDFDEEDPPSTETKTDEDGGEASAATVAIPRSLSVQEESSLTVEDDDGEAHHLEAEGVEQRVVGPETPIEGEEPSVSTEGVDIAGNGAERLATEDDTPPATFEDKDPATSGAAEEHGLESEAQVAGVRETLGNTGSSDKEEATGGPDEVEKQEDAVLEKQGGVVVDPDAELDAGEHGAPEVPASSSEAPLQSSRSDEELYEEDAYDDFDEEDPPSTETKTDEDGGEASAATVAIPRSLSVQEESSLTVEDDDGEAHHLEAEGVEQRVVGPETPIEGEEPSVSTEGVDIAGNGAERLATEDDTPPATFEDKDPATSGAAEEHGLESEAQVAGVRETLGNTGSSDKEEATGGPDEVEKQEDAVLEKQGGVVVDPDAELDAGEHGAPEVPASSSEAPLQSSRSDEELYEEDAYDDFDEEDPPSTETKTDEDGGEASAATVAIPRSLSVQEESSLTVEDDDGEAHHLEVEGVENRELEPAAHSEEEEPSVSTEVVSAAETEAEQSIVEDEAPATADQNGPATSAEPEDHIAGSSREHEETQATSNSGEEIERRADAALGSEDCEQPQSDAHYLAEAPQSEKEDAQDPAVAAEAVDLANPDASTGEDTLETPPLDVNVSATDDFGGSEAEEATHLATARSDLGARSAEYGDDDFDDAGTGDGPHETAEGTEDMAATSDQPQLEDDGAMDLAAGEDGGPARSEENGEADALQMAGQDKVTTSEASELPDVPLEDELAALSPKAGAYGDDDFDEDAEEAAADTSQQEGVEQDAASDGSAPGSSRERQANGEDEGPATPMSPKDESGLAAAVSESERVLKIEPRDLAIPATSPDDGGDPRSVVEDPVVEEPSCDIDVELVLEPEAPDQAPESSLETLSLAKVAVEEITKADDAGDAAEDKARPSDAAEDEEVTTTVSDYASDLTAGEAKASEEPEEATPASDQQREVSPTDAAEGDETAVDTEGEAVDPGSGSLDLVASEVVKAAALPSDGNDVLPAPVPTEEQYVDELGDEDAAIGSEAVGSGSAAVENDVDVRERSSQQSTESVEELAAKSVGGSESLGAEARDPLEVPNAQAEPTASDETQAEAEERNDDSEGAQELEAVEAALVVDAVPAHESGEVKSDEVESTGDPPSMSEEPTPLADPVAPPVEAAEDSSPSDQAGGDDADPSAIDGAAAEPSPGDGKLQGTEDPADTSGVQDATASPEAERAEEATELPVSVAEVEPVEEREASAAPSGDLSPSLPEEIASFESIEELPTSENSLPPENKEELTESKPLSEEAQPQVGNEVSPGLSEAPEATAEPLEDERPSEPTEDMSAASDIIAQAPIEADSRVLVVENADISADETLELPQTADIPVGSEDPALVLDTTTQSEPTASGPVEVPEASEELQSPENEYDDQEAFEEAEDPDEMDAGESVVASNPTALEPVAAEAEAPTSPFEDDYEDFEDEEKAASPRVDGRAKPVAAPAPSHSSSPDDGDEEDAYEEEMDEEAESPQPVVPTEATSETEAEDYGDEEVLDEVEYEVESAKPATAAAAQPVDAAELEEDVEYEESDFED